MTDLSAAGPGPAPFAAPAPAPFAAPAAPEAPAAPAVVDFDAGQNWGSETIALNHPFKLAGVTYTQIVIRAASGNDVANYVAGDTGVVKFAVMLTGVPELVLRALHAEDYKIVARKVAGFLI